jgi:hypothetical protein
MSTWLQQPTLVLALPVLKGLKPPELQTTQLGNSVFWEVCCSVMDVNATEETRTLYLICSTKMCCTSFQSSCLVSFPSSRELLYMTFTCTSFTTYSSLAFQSFGLQCSIGSLTRCNCSDNHDFTESAWKMSSSIHGSSGAGSSMPYGRALYSASWLSTLWTLLFRTMVCLVVW